MADIGIGSAMTHLLQVTLNGCARVDAVPDNLLLLDYLREHVGLGIAGVAWPACWRGGW
jgi:hypothetical protein